MKLKYKNNFFDYYLFTCMHQFTLVTLQIIYLIFCVLLALVFVSIPKNGVIAALITAVIVYFVFWIFQFVINLFLISARRNKSILTDHIVEIQPEAFYEETKYQKSYYYWSGVEKVVRFPFYVGVYVSQHLVHIIPVHTFASKDEINQFIGKCRERMLKNS